LKFWIPRSVLPDHDVQDGQQLAHAGDEDEFERLAGLTQPIGEATWAIPSSVLPNEKR
jgi:hypothetical protein